MLLLLLHRGLLCLLQQPVELVFVDQTPIDDLSPYGHDMNGSSEVTQMTRRKRNDRVRFLVSIKFMRYDGPIGLDRREGSKKV